MGQNEYARDPFDTLKPERALAFELVCGVAAGGPSAGVAILGLLEISGGAFDAAVDLLGEASDVLVLVD